MVIGVTERFYKIIKLVGVIELLIKDKKLDLALGYSHNIVLMVASEVTLETISEKVKQLLETSFDKQL
jgi:large subunit ribosomal protein L6